MAAEASPVHKGPHTMLRHTRTARPGLEALEPRQLFATTALDPYFGTDGVFTQNFGDVNDARALVIQPDGKIVVAGGKDSVFIVPGTQAVIRLLPDGTPDTSFTNPALPYGDYDFVAAAVQDDGKILVSGGVRFPRGAGRVPFIARLNDDGSLDSSFSGDGFLDPIDDGRNGFVTSLSVLPDGKILFAGGTTGSMEVSLDPFVGRLLDNGTLDSSYGQTGGGLTRFDALTEHFAVSSAVLATTDSGELAVLPDGSLIMCGVYKPSAHSKYAAIARVSADGQRDVTFGNGGIKQLPSVSGSDIM